MSNSYRNILRSEYRYPQFAAPKVSQSRFWTPTGGQIPTPIDSLSEIEVLPILPDIADSYGVIRSDLESDGSPIGQNDLWIAAQARALEATLVTADEGEFRKVEGLAVENWLLG